MALSSRGEGGVFAGALDFDKAAVAEHGDVHVDVGVDVFLVIEIERRGCLRRCRR